MRSEHQTTARAARNAGPGPRPRQPLYTAVLRLHRATRTELAEAMDGPVEKVGSELDQLVAARRGGRAVGRVSRPAPGRRARPAGRRAARPPGRGEPQDRLRARLDPRPDPRLRRRPRLPERHRSPWSWSAGPTCSTRASMGMAVQAPPMTLLTAIPDERTMIDFARKYADPWIEAQRHGPAAPADDRPGRHPGAPRRARPAAPAWSTAGGQVRTLDQVPSWFVARGTRRRRPARARGAATCPSTPTTSTWCGPPSWWARCARSSRSCGPAPCPLPWARREATAWCRCCGWPRRACATSRSPASSACRSVRCAPGSPTPCPNWALSHAFTQVWRPLGAAGWANAPPLSSRFGHMVGRCWKTSPATRSRMTPTTRPRRWASSTTPSR